MTISPELAQLQRAGFPMGGEPLVALDLVDTVMLAVDPPVDLLSTQQQAAAWWRLQAPRLPAGPPPELGATHLLRSAIRDVLMASLERRRPRRAALDLLNAVARSAPRSVRLVVGATGPRREVRWHTESGGNARLAATACEAIDLASSPELLVRLRRCASPDCSMLFLATNPRRQWCADNVCGNRARVARHYHRSRGGS